MKKYKVCIPILTCLLLAAGCGTAQNKPAPSSGDASSFADSDSSETGLSSGDASSGETLSQTELAMAAYSDFLSGDVSLFDSEQIRIWGLEGWADFLKTEFQYEYTYLALDGDGMEELLIQMEGAPLIYNAVFHYADGALFCWNNDMVEMTSGSYPLADGTMVSQYDYSGTRSYTIFRYLPDGERENIASLYARDSLTDEDSELPCPYYEVDGAEVDQTVFEEQLEELITKQLLPRSAWTIL